MLCNLFLQLHLKQPSFSSEKYFYRIVVLSALLYIVLFSVCGSGVCLLAVFDCLIFNFRFSQVSNYSRLHSSVEQPDSHNVHNLTIPRKSKNVLCTDSGDTPRLPELESTQFTPFEHDICDTFKATSNNLFKTATTTDMSVLSQTRR